MTATAHLDAVSPYCQAQHHTEADKVEAIMESVEARAEEHGWDAAWDLPPILVIESEGNGATLLDGHHRAEAARRLGLPDIPAWVISVDDYCRILEEHFYGCAPARLSDLDDYIIVDGRPYNRGEHELEAHA